jgi:hypothetical protein
MAGFIHIDDGRLLDLSLKGSNHRFQGSTQLPFSNSRSTRNFCRISVLLGGSWQDLLRHFDFRSF